MADDLRALLHSVAPDDLPPDHGRIRQRGRRLRARRRGALGATVAVIALAVVGVGHALTESVPTPSVADAPGGGEAPDDAEEDDAVQGSTQEEVDARFAWERAAREELPPPPEGALSADGEAWVEDPAAACGWLEEVLDTAARLPGWEVVDAGEWAGEGEAVRLALLVHRGEFSAPAARVLGYCTERDRVTLEQVDEPWQQGGNYVEGDDSWYRVRVGQPPTPIDRLMSLDQGGFTRGGQPLDHVEKPGQFCMWLDDTILQVLDAADGMGVERTHITRGDQVADAVLEAAWDQSTDQYRTDGWGALQILDACEQHR